MNEVESLIFSLKAEAKTIKDRYNIALLTNTRSKTREINNQPINYSSNSEFFTDREYSEVLDGIQSAGFFVEPFFNEINFILTTLNEAYYQNKRFVYNLARNGNFIGKKSLIPSFCDLMSIPYTGSDAFVISFSRAKYMYTKYIESHNISVPKSWVFSSDGWLNNNKPNYGTKVLIKPMHESASIGLSSASVITYDEVKERELENCSYSEGRASLIQEFIEGYECEVPILISKKSYALNPVGISIDAKNKLGESILTYNHSLDDSYDFYCLEKEFSISIIETIKSTASQIAKLVGLRGYGRVDFRIDSKGTPYLMDIAASPYTTNHSSFAFAFRELGLEYHDIYSSIIGLSANSQSSRME